MVKSTKIVFDGKEVKELRIHFMGEDFVWFEGITKDGERIQTLPLRGEI